LKYAAYVNGSAFSDIPPANGSSYSDKTHLDGMIPCSV